MTTISQATTGPRASCQIDRPPLWVSMMGRRMRSGGRAARGSEVSRSKLSGSRASPPRVAPIREGKPLSHCTGGSGMASGPVLDSPGPRIVSNLPRATETESAESFPGRGAFSTSYGLVGTLARTRYPQLVGDEAATKAFGPDPAWVRSIVAGPTHGHQGGAGARSAGRTGPRGAVSNAEEPRKRAGRNGHPIYDNARLSPWALYETQ